MPLKALTFPFLLQIDTEGHDIVILKDLLNFEFRPPIIWVEWFMKYKYVGEIINNQIMEEDPDYCTPDSLNLFTKAIQLGISILGLPSILKK